jgi:hypothetical protein
MWGFMPIPFAALIRRRAKQRRRAAKEVAS